MRLLLHPAALGLALALAAIAAARAISHAPAPPAHLVGHALEMGGLYLIGMTGAAFVIAWLSPGSPGRWLRPLILYVALGLVAIGAEMLTDVAQEGTPLGPELRELAIGWAGLLVVVVAGTWLQPLLNRLEGLREVDRPVDARRSVAPGRVESEHVAPVPPTRSLAAGEWEAEAIAYVAVGVWAVSSVTMLLFDAGDGSGVSPALLAVLAGGFLASPFLGLVAVGVSTGIRRLHRGHGRGEGSEIAITLAVALPIVVVVGLTMLMQQTGR